MSKVPLTSDIMAVCRGLKKIQNVALQQNSEMLNKKWRNSSVKPVTEKGIEIIKDVYSGKKKSITLESSDISEAFARANTVVEGFKVYLKNRSAYPKPFKDSYINSDHQGSSESQVQVLEGLGVADDGKQSLQNLNAMMQPSSLFANAAVQNISVAASAAKEELDKSINGVNDFAHTVHTEQAFITEDDLNSIAERISQIHSIDYAEDLKLTKRYQEIEPRHIELLKTRSLVEDLSIKKDLTGRVKSGTTVAKDEPSSNHFKDQTLINFTKTQQKQKPIAKTKPNSMLSEEAKARRVPHSRIGRLATFGGLVASLGVGTVAELTRRSLAGKDSSLSPFLSDANAKRIVDTLCRVRGAALKVGQMLSLQDNSLINPELQKIFERVRQSADFMPLWQLEKTLVNEFGEDWRHLVANFEEKPFAAASIGQVHMATMYDGSRVAMKIQYPGVAAGIDSDITNLITTLKFANVLPEGMFVDSAIAVAKKELKWECDYEREKTCTKNFANFIKPYNDFYVPEVVDELCTEKVFTTELIEGTPVDKCISLDQETRNHICALILQLCLMEVFRFGYMQTDPNWGNFFYNSDTKQVTLLDFGACREYEKSFVDKYINVIHGAATQDRQKVLEFSKQLGFLTGFEAKVMEDSHIDAVMILGEAFQRNENFAFGEQNTTSRIHSLIPVMLSHRMCPPPEESYSLHRKLAGVFLLCSKLNANINCKPFFDEVYGEYEFGGNWEVFRAKRGEWD